MKLTEIVRGHDTSDNSYTVIIKLDGVYFETVVYSENEQQSIYEKFKDHLDQ